MNDEENQKNFDEIKELVEDENVSSADDPIHKGTKASRPFFIVVLLIIIIAAIVYFSENSITEYIPDFNNEDSFSEEYSNEELSESEMDKAFEEYKKNIEISRIVDLQGDSYVLLTNNNNIEIKDLELYIIYYDENNSPIEVENEFFYGILPNGKAASSLYDSPKEFARYDFLLKSNYYGNDYNISCTDDLKYEHNEYDDEIIISFKNDSDKKIDSVSFLAIFYNNNNEIVSIKNTYDIDIKSRKEYEANIYKEDNLEFDKYEIILQEAYRRSENY